MEERFKDWQKPEFDEKGMTKWNWMCQHDKEIWAEVRGEATKKGDDASVSREAYP